MRAITGASSSGVTRVHRVVKCYICLASVAKARFASTTEDAIAVSLQMTQWEQIVC